MKVALFDDGGSVLVDLENVAVFDQNDVVIGVSRNVILDKFLL